MVIRPRKPYMRGRINVAEYYSRPALPPFVLGPGSRMGIAQRNLQQQYEYTMRQLAVSPFAVNNEALIGKVRDEYGYSDDGTYEAMGVVGGVVGAGVGALVGSGKLTPSFKSPKNWWNTGNPFLEPMSKRAAARVKANTVTRVQETVTGLDNHIKNYIINHKGVITREGVLNAANDYIESAFVDLGNNNYINSVKEGLKHDVSVFVDNNIKEAETLLEQIRTSNKVKKEVAEKINEVVIKQTQGVVEGAKTGADEAARAAYKRARRRVLQSEEVQALIQAERKKQILAKAKRLNVSPDKVVLTLSEKQKITKEILNNQDIVAINKNIVTAKVTKELEESLTKEVTERTTKEVLENATKVGLEKATKEVTEEALETAAKKAAEEAIEKAAKEGAELAAKKGAITAGKLTAGLVPYIGAAVSLGAIGLDVYSLVQSAKAGDVVNIILDSALLALDAADAILDIVAPGINVATSVIIALASMIVGAVQGWYVGTTVGHSLTKEGARVQQMFTENLLSSTIHRPISSIGTIVTMFTLPALITGLESAAGKVGMKASQRMFSFLNHNAIGNQVRAGLNMLAVQGIQKLTMPLDAMLPWHPENPEDMNFVTAMSIYGDFNDNMYGATRNKAILLGLAKNDPDAKKKAIARAWGFSNEMTYAINFDDVRQAFGIETGVPFLNSLISVAGEMLIDPQNFHEVKIKRRQEELVNAVSNHITMKLMPYDLDAKEFNDALTGIDLLTSKVGILRNHRGRHSTISHIVRIFLDAEDKKDFTKKMMNLFVVDIKRSDITIQRSRPKIDQQIEALHTLLTDVFEGDDHNTVRSKYIHKQKELEDSLESDKLLLQKMAASTAMNLIMQNGITSADMIIGRYIQDLNIKHDLKRLYYGYQTYRNHMDLSDAVATSILKGGNPLGALVKLGLNKKIFQRIGWFFRDKFGGTEQRQKLSDTTLETLTAEEESLKVRKEQLEQLIKDKQREHDIDVFLEKSGVDEEKQMERVREAIEIIDDEDGVLAATVEKVNAELVEIQAALEATKKLREIYYNKWKESGAIQYVSSSKKVVVTADNYQEIKSDVDKYEKKLSEKMPLEDALRIAKQVNNEEYTTYVLKKQGLEDFDLMTIEDVSMLKGFENFQVLLTYMSFLNVEIEENVIYLLRAINTYTQLYNEIVEIDVVRAFVNEFNNIVNKYYTTKDVKKRKEYLAQIKKMKKDSLYTHTREIDGFDNYFKGQKKNADAVLLTPGLTSKALPKKITHVFDVKKYNEKTESLKGLRRFLETHGISTIYVNPVVDVRRRTKAARGDLLEFEIKQTPEEVFISYLNRHLPKEHRIFYGFPWEKPFITQKKWNKLSRDARFKYIMSRINEFFKHTKQDVSDLIRNDVFNIIHTINNYKRHGMHFTKQDLNKVVLYKIITDRMFTKDSKYNDILKLIKDEAVKIEEYLHFITENKDLTDAQRKSLQTTFTKMIANLKRTEMFKHINNHVQGYLQPKKRESKFFIKESILKEDYLNMKLLDDALNYKNATPVAKQNFFKSIIYDDDARALHLINEEFNVVTEDVFISGSSFTLRENYNIPNIRSVQELKKLKADIEKAVDERVAKEATASDVDEETSSTDSKSEIVKGDTRFKKQLSTDQMLADIEVIDNIIEKATAYAINRDKQKEYAETSHIQYDPDDEYTYLGERKYNHIDVNIDMDIDVENRKINKVRQAIVVRETRGVYMSNLDTPVRFGEIFHKRRIKSRESAAWLMVRNLIRVVEDSKGHLRFSENTVPLGTKKDRVQRFLFEKYFSGEEIVIEYVTKEIKSVLGIRHDSVTYPLRDDALSYIKSMFEKQDKRDYTKREVNEKLKQLSDAEFLNLMEDVREHLANKSFQDTSNFYMRKVREATEDLAALELKLLNGEKQSVLTPSTDLPKLEIFGTARFEEILNDIISIGEGRWDDLNTTTYRILKLFRETIVEDYAHKYKLNFDDLIDWEITDHGIYFINKDRQKFSLISMLLNYPLDAASFNNLIDHIAKVKQTALETLIYDRALLQAEYQMLYDTYGTIITANTFDIDYDVFVKLEINKDADSEEIDARYNLLKDRKLNLLDALIRLQNKEGERYTAQFTPETLAIYSELTALVEKSKAHTKKAKAETGDVDTAEDGITKINILDTVYDLTDPADFVKVFLYKIITSEKITTEEKKTLLQTVFFYDTQRTRKEYNNKQLKKLERRINKLKQKLDTHVAGSENKTVTEVQLKKALEQQRHILDIQQGSETDARKPFEKVSIDKLIDEFLANDDGIKLALDVVGTMTYSDNKFTTVAYDENNKPVTIYKYYETKEGTREKAYREEGKGLVGYNAIIMEFVFNESKGESAAERIKSAEEEGNALNEKFKDTFKNDAATEDIKIIAAGTDTVLIANGDTKLIEHYKRVLDKKYVYTITEQQYKEVVEMYKGNIPYSDTATLYTTEHSKILPDTTNVKSIKVLIPLYFEGLDNLLKAYQRNKNVLDELKKLDALKRQGGFLIPKAANIGTTFDNSERFRLNYERTKTHKAFSFFLEELEDAEKLNIENIASKLFTNTFMKSEVPITKEQIENEFKTLKEQQDLRDIVINGRTLLDILTDAVNKTREQFLGQDVLFNFKDILSTEYIDFLLDMSSKARDLSYIITTYYKHAKEMQEDLNEYYVDNDELVSIINKTGFNDRYLLSSADIKEFNQRLKDVGNDDFAMIGIRDIIAKEKEKYRLKRNIAAKAVKNKVNPNFKYKLLSALYLSGSNLYKKDNHYFDFFKELIDPDTFESLVKEAHGTTEDEKRANVLKDLKKVLDIYFNNIYYAGHFIKKKTLGGVNFQMIGFQVYEGIRAVTKELITSFKNDKRYFKKVKKYVDELITGAGTLENLAPTTHSQLSKHSFKTQEEQDLFIVMSVIAERSFDIFNTDPFREATEGVYNKGVESFLFHYTNVAQKHRADVNLKKYVPKNIMLLDLSLKPSIEIPPQGIALPGLMMGISNYVRTGELLHSFVPSNNGDIENNITIAEYLAASEVKDDEQKYNALVEKYTRMTDILEHSIFNEKTKDTPQQIVKSATEAYKTIPDFIVENNINNTGKYLTYHENKLKEVDKNDPNYADYLLEIEVIKNINDYYIGKSKEDRRVVMPAAIANDPNKSMLYFMLYDMHLRNLFSVLIYRKMQLERGVKIENIFESPYWAVKKINLSVLNNDRKFFDYVKARFINANTTKKNTKRMVANGVTANRETLQLIGFNQEVLAGLEKSNTLYNFLIYTYGTLESNPSNIRNAVRFALLLNELKLQYIAEKGVEHTEIVEKLEKTPVEKGVKFFNKFDKVLGEKDENQSNIKEAIKEDMLFIKTALSRQKARIENTSRIIDGEYEYTEHGLSAQKYVHKNVKAKTLAIQVNYDLTKDLFIDSTEEMTDVQQLQSDIQQRHGDGILFTIAAMDAPNYNSIGHTSPKLNGTVKAVSDILFALDPSIPEHKFVQIHEVTNYIRLLKTDRNMNNVFVEIYNQAVELMKMKGHDVQLDDAFKAAKKWFDDNLNVLFHFNEELLKGLIGYVYTTKSDTLNITVEEAVTNFKTLFEKQNKLQRDSNKFYRNTVNNEIRTILTLGYQKEAYQILKKRNKKAIPSAESVRKLDVDLTAKTLFGVIHRRNFDENNPDHQKILERLVMLVNMWRSGFNAHKIINVHDNTRLLSNKLKEPNFDLNSVINDLFAVKSNSDNLVEAFEKNEALLNDVALLVHYNYTKEKVNNEWERFPEAATSEDVEKLILEAEERILSNLEKIKENKELDDVKTPQDLRIQLYNNVYKTPSVQARAELIQNSIYTRERNSIEASLRKNDDNYLEKTRNYGYEKLEAFKKLYEYRKNYDDIASKFKQEILTDNKYTRKDLFNAIKNTHPEIYKQITDLLKEHTLTDKTIGEVLDIIYETRDAITVSYKIKEDVQGKVNKSSWHYDAWSTNYSIFNKQLTQLEAGKNTIPLHVYESARRAEYSEQYNMPVGKKKTKTGGFKHLFNRFLDIHTDAYSPRYFKEDKIRELETLVNRKYRKNKHADFIAHLKSFFNLTDVMTDLFDVWLPWYVEAQNEYGRYEKNKKILASLDKINEENKTLKSFIDNYKETRERLIGEIHTALKAEEEARTDFNKADAHSRKIYRDNVSPINIYKHNNKIYINDADAIRGVVKELAYGNKEDEDRLWAVIEKGGDKLNKHNPITNSLFMYANALKQNKNIQSPVVVHADTYIAENGSHQPYRLVIVKRIDGKITVINQYVQSPDFYPEEDGSWREPLNALYEDLKKDWQVSGSKRLSEEDLKKRFTKMLKDIQTAKLELPTLTLLSNIISDNKNTIVLTSSKDFNTDSLPSFIVGYLQRSIVNELSANIRKTTPLDLLKDKGVNDLISEGAIQALYEELETRKTEIKEGRYRDKRSLDYIAALVNKISERIVSTVVSLQLAANADELGFTFNDRIREAFFKGEDSPIGELLDLIQKYIVHNIDKEEIYKVFTRNLDARYDSPENVKKLKEHIDEFLRVVVGAYEDALNGIEPSFDTEEHKSIRSQILDHFKNKLKIIDLPDDDLKQMVSSTQLIQLQQRKLKELEILRTLAIDATKGGNKDIIGLLKDRLAAMKAEQDELTEKLKQLEQVVETYAKDQEVITNRLIDEGADYNAITDDLWEKASKVLNTNIKALRINLSNADFLDYTKMSNIIEAQYLGEIKNNIELFSKLVSYVESNEEQAKIEEIFNEFIDNKDIPYLKQQIEAITEMLDTKRYYLEDDALAKFNNAIISYVEETDNKILDLVNRLGIKSIDGQDTLDKSKLTLNVLRHIRESLKEHTRSTHNQAVVELLRLLKEEGRYILSKQYLIDNDTSVILTEPFIEHIETVLIDTLDTYRATLDFLEFEPTKEIEGVDTRKQYNKQRMMKMYSILYDRVKRYKEYAEYAEAMDFVNILSNTLPAPKTLEEWRKYNSQRTRDPESGVYIYRDAFEGHNRFIIVLDEDTIHYYRDPETGRYTFQIYDEEHHNAIKITAALNSEGNYGLFVEGNYNYYTKENYLISREPAKSPLNFSSYGVEWKKFTNIINGNFYNTLLKNIKGNLYITDKEKDSSFKAWNKAYNVMKVLKDAKEGDDLISKLESNKDIKALNLKVNSITELGNNDSLRLVDATADAIKKYDREMRVKSKIVDELQIDDIAPIQRATYEKYIKPLESLHGDHIALKLPEEGFYDAFPDLSQDFITKHNLYPINTTEALANQRFGMRNFATYEPALQTNIAPIRSMLASKLMTQRMTKIKVINELLKIDEESEVKQDNLIYYLADQNKTLQEELKVLEADTSIHNLNRKIELRTRVARNNFLIRTYTDPTQEEGKTLYADVFTPNIVTEKQYEDYRQDALHKIGINITVGLYNIPDVFEDNYAMDAEFARNLWVAGQKTFLHAYGFKGSPRIVEGLKAKTGADIIASDASVDSRGVSAVRVEMALNVIRKFLIDERDHEGNSTLTKEQLKILRAHGIKKKLLDAFTIKGDKLIVTDKIAYHDVMDDIINGNFYKLIEAHVYEDIKFNFRNAKNERDFVTMKPSDTFYRGELYVVMDSSNLSQDAQTRSALLEVDGIAVPLANTSGSILKGFLLSNVVSIALKQRIGIELYNELFPPVEDYIDEFVKMSELGFQYYFEDRENITKEEYEDALNKIQHKDLRRRLQQYYNIFTSYKNNEGVRKKMLAEKNREVKNYANKKLYEGPNSIIYGRNSRRYPGVRAQSLTNPELEIGTGILPKLAYEELLKHEKLWQVEESLNDEDWKYATSFTSNYKDTKYTTANKGMSITFNNKYDYYDYIDKLNRNGIINTDTITIYETDKKSYTIKFRKKARVVGYTLIVRSPVQSYGAVSMIKIVGFNNHYSVELSPYIYPMMKMDNDGDQIGIMAISKKHIDKLKNLDASKLSYYDNMDFWEATTREKQKDKPSDYLMKVQSDLKGHGISTRIFTHDEHYKLNAKFYETGDKQYEVPTHIVGIRGDLKSKKTYNKTLRPDNIRTYFELFASTYDNFKKYFGLKKNPKWYSLDNKVYDLIENASKNLLIDKKTLKAVPLNTQKDESKHYTLDEYIDQMTYRELNRWVNVYMRSHYRELDYTDEYPLEDIYSENATDGVAKKFINKNLTTFKKIIAFEKMYEANKELTDVVVLSERELDNHGRGAEIFNNYDLNTVEDIYERIKTDYQLKQQIEQITMNELIDSENYKTVQRAFVSKKEIGTIGSARLALYKGSHIIFNYDLNENPWVLLKARTVNDLGNILLGEDVFEKLKNQDDYPSLEDILELMPEEHEMYIYKTSEDDSVKKYLANILFENLRDANLVVKELPSILRFFGSETTTVGDVKSILENSSLKDDQVVKSLLSLNTSHIISNKLKAQILTYYFGSDIVTIQKILKGTLIKLTEGKIEDQFKDAVMELSKGFFEQKLIRRYEMDILDDAMQVPISLTKHGATNMNLVKHFQEVKAQAQEIRELAKRKLSTGLTENYFIGSNVFAEKQLMQEIKNRREDISDGTKGIMIPESFINREDIRRAYNSITDAIMLNSLFKNIPNTAAGSILPEFEKIFTNLNDALKADDIDEINRNLKLLWKMGINFDHLRFGYNRIQSVYFILSNTMEQTFGMSKKYKLKAKDSKWLKNKEHFVKFLNDMSLRSFRNDFIERSKDEIVKSFLLNDFAEEEYNIRDEEGNIIQYSGGAGFKKLSDNEHELFKKQDALQQDYIAHVLRARNVDLNHNKKTIDDIAEALMNAITAAFKSIDNIDVTTDVNTKISRDRYYRRALHILDDLVYKKQEVKEHLLNITREANKYTNTQNKIKEINEQITYLREQLQSIDESLKALEQEKYQQTKGHKNPKIVVKAFDDLLKQKQEALQKSKDYILRSLIIQNLGGLMKLLATPEGLQMSDFTTFKPEVPDSKDKIITQEDVNKAHNMRLENAYNRQAPFLDIISPMKKGPAFDDYDWDELYKWYEQSPYYLTKLTYAYDYETLAYTLLDLFRLTDAVPKKVVKKLKIKTVKDLKKFINDYIKPNGIEEAFSFNQQRFNGIHNLLLTEQKNIAFAWKGKRKRVDSLSDVTEPQKNVLYMVKKQYYLWNGEIFVEQLGIDQFVNPTLKVEEIRSGKDLKRVFNLVTRAEDPFTFGFTTKDDFMSSIKESYKPYMLQGRFAPYINRFLQIQKLTMRLSLGFLFRNLTDTYHQLVSKQVEQNGMYALTNKEILYNARFGAELYEAYQKYSEERMFTLASIQKDIIDIEALLKRESSHTDVIDTKLNRIIDSLESYIIITRHNNRSEYKLEYAGNLLNRLHKVKEHKNLQYDPYVLDSVLQFLGNLSFAEYYTVYDNQFIDNRWVAGLRVDARDADGNIKQETLKKVRKGRSEYDKMFNQNFQEMLFDISAFMQSNAQIDEYKQKQFIYLNEFITNYKKQIAEGGPKELTIDEIKTQLASNKKKLERSFSKLLGSFGTSRYTYDSVNEWIENVARITGYLNDRRINKYTHNDGIHESLKQWFNYGQRDPIEVKFIMDIPYLSFPLRTVGNWIDRLFDASYMRFLDDVISGIYGQFADEDGQYDEFVRFQIQNGWIPITKTWGIRVGNGAFDVLDIINASGDTIQQRTNPILNGVRTLIETKDLEKAFQALATTGIFKRMTNTLTAVTGTRELAQKHVPEIVSNKPASFGSAISMTYDINSYKKYTPYAYRYPNNGRYARYENIYRDWFNKYGRMRRPKVDPLSLVKDIQWQQYVRWRRQQNMWN